MHDNSRVQLGNTYDYSTHHHYRDETKLDLRRALDFPRMEYRYDTIASVSSQTAQWLFETPQYARWHDPAARFLNGGCLWIKGKPGAGKSTIMKALLKDTHEKHPDAKVVYFFFNARGEGLERSVEGMYRALLYQMVDDVPHLQGMVNRTALEEYSQTQWPLELLKDLFRIAILHLSGKHSLRCFVDALDEGGSEDDVRDMIHLFSELAESAFLEHSSLSVCFASRHYPKISIRLCEHLVLENQGGHHECIAGYITAKLRLGNQALEQELGSEIQLRSAGVFLWIVLVIGIMNKEADRGNHHRLREKLRATPLQIYDLIRELISKDKDERLLPAVQWLLYFGHKMTVDHLYNAIIVSTGHLKGDSLRHNHSANGEVERSFILSSTKGLTEITGSGSFSDTYVQFIHETVREYFLNHGLQELDPSLAGCGNVAGICHTRLSKWCRDYVHLAWQHYLESKLLFNAQPRWREGSWSAASWDLPFLLRALDGMLQHAELASEREIFGVTSGNSILMRLWNFAKSFKNRQYLREPAFIAESSLSMLHVLADKGHVNLLNDQLKECRKLTQVKRYLLINAQAGRLGTALHLAAENGHHVIAQALIDNGADINAFVAYLGTPLYVAVSNKSERIMDILLQHHANEHAAQEKKVDILHVAIEKGSLSMVTELLRHGFGRNEALEDDGFALRLAASHDENDITGALLNYGYSANAHSGNGCTALHAALVDDYHISSVEPKLRSLLSRGADVNTECLEHGTALHMILSKEQPWSATAVLLLEYGADVDFFCIRRGTPLNAAIWNPYPALLAERSNILESLVAHSKALFEPIGEHGNAIETAGRYNDYAAMRALMKHGINVRADDFSETGPYENPEVARRRKDRPRSPFWESRSDEE